MIWVCAVAFMVASFMSGAVRRTADRVWWGFVAGFALVSRVFVAWWANA